MRLGIHTLPAFMGYSPCYLSRPMASDELYRRQIARLFERSPFYREKLSSAGFVSPQDVGGLAEIGRLPFTEKDELPAAQAEHPPLAPPPPLTISQIPPLH